MYRKLTAYRRSNQSELKYRSRIGLLLTQSAAIGMIPLGTKASPLSLFALVQNAARNLRLCKLMQFSMADAEVKTT